MNLTIKNTYGQPHRTSDGNPNHVVSADRYRLPLTGFLVAGAPGFDDMVKWLQNGDTDLHTRPEGYGLIFLESEEFSATYFGPIDQVQQYQRENQATGGQAAFDQSQGIMVGQWPHGKGWDEFLPQVFWNQAQRGDLADGIGLITAFEHAAIPSAEVIVYEFEGKWLGESDPVPMVTYHCTGCHSDTFHNGGHVHENTGPSSRRWAARQARQHISSAVRHGVGSENTECRPRDGEMLRAVNAVAKDKLGLTHNPLPSTEDGYCATKGPCSIIRELRAGIRPAAYQA
jgi:hypothetical protein